MSKTKNKTAKRKNRKENGSRADIFGSKPHSNGDIFSLSLEDRADNKKAAKKTTMGRIIAKIHENKDKVISLRARECQS